MYWLVNEQLCHTLPKAGYNWLEITVTEQLDYITCDVISSHDASFLTAIKNNFFLVRFGTMIQWW